jgi:hypothetical protein
VNADNYKDYEVYTYKATMDQVYKKRWYNRILLKRKTPYEGVVDQNKIYDPSHYSHSYIQN